MWSAEAAVEHEAPHRPHNTATHTHTHTWEEDAVQDAPIAGSPVPHPPPKTKETQQYLHMYCRWLVVVLLDAPIAGSPAG